MEISSLAIWNAISPIHIQTPTDRRADRSNESAFRNHAVSLCKKGPNRLGGMAGRLAVRL